MFSKWGAEKTRRELEIEKSQHRRVRETKRYDAMLGYKHLIINIMNIARDICP